MSKISIILKWDIIKDRCIELQDFDSHYKNRIIKLEKYYGHDVSKGLNISYYKSENNIKIIHDFFMNDDNIKKLDLNMRSIYNTFINLKKILFLLTDNKPEFNENYIYFICLIRDILDKSNENKSKTLEVSDNFGIWDDIVQKYKIYYLKYREPYQRIINILYTNGYIIEQSILRLIIIVDKYEPTLKYQLNILNGKLYFEHTIQVKKEKIIKNIECIIDKDTINKIKALNSNVGKYLIYNSYTENKNIPVGDSTFTDHFKNTYKYKFVNKSFIIHIINTCKDINYLNNINNILNSTELTKYIKKLKSKT